MTACFLSDEEKEESLVKSPLTCRCTRGPLSGASLTGALTRTNPGILANGDGDVAVLHVWLLSKVLAHDQFEYTTLKSKPASHKRCRRRNKAPFYAFAGGEILDAIAVELAHLSVSSDERRAIIGENFSWKSSTCSKTTYAHDGRIG
ncbi:hypothetical protein MSG28_007320 [Choristoneura fumiferana]|uniref:Uncharacterized protein n=1 Tax=Choristoneura fumiferana TaxID=7141 RepID=A0ACC0JWQ6_CHOFU|nr:hypothetical protein MSG28_007320 [Choristoneura fumiferana]